MIFYFCKIVKNPDKFTVRNKYLRTYSMIENMFGLALALVIWINFNSIYVSTKRRYKTESLLNLRFWSVFIHSRLCCSCILDITYARLAVISFIDFIRWLEAFNHAHMRLHVSAALSGCSSNGITCKRDGFHSWMVISAGFCSIRGRISLGSFYTNFLWTNEADYKAKYLI